MFVCVSVVNVVYVCGVCVSVFVGVFGWCFCVYVSDVSVLCLWFVCYVCGLCVCWCVCLGVCLCCVCFCVCDEFSVCVVCVVYVCV